ncbi:MAG: SPASM domain-containing protein [Oscillospiraceae bacterium]
MFKTIGDVYLIYNSETNCFLEITKKTYDILKKIELDLGFISELDDTIRDNLVAHKILVVEGANDNLIARLKRQFLKANLDSSRLALTILPTNDCNMCCPYCFEAEKKKGIMSKFVIQELIQFIKKQEDVKRLSITWYGGEPLMAFSVMQNIMKQIANEIIIPVTEHKIVTNGYLLNKDVCSFFNDYNLTDIQISFDGVEATHNKSRILKKNNGATYQVMLNNIDLLLKECPNVKIHIRVNISQNNVDEYIIVKNQLKKLFHSKQVDVYPGFIFVVDGQGRYLIPPSLSRQEKQAVFLKDRDHKMLYPSKKGKGCAATQVNSYLVGASGELYKCWGDVNNQNKVIGYLDGRVGNVDLANRYLSTSCFNDEKCLQCFFLPICSGGCNKDRIANNDENGEFDLCSLYKDRDFLEECLERYYVKSLN